MNVAVGPQLDSVITVLYPLITFLYANNSCIAHIYIIQLKTKNLAHTKVSKFYF